MLPDPAQFRRLRWLSVRRSSVRRGRLVFRAAGGGATRCPFYFRATQTPKLILMLYCGSLCDIMHCHGSVVPWRILDLFDDTRDTRQ